MNKITIKIFIYLGLLLGLFRIIIHFVISQVRFDSWYFVDIFIFTYLCLWPLVIKLRKVYSLPNLLIINFSISTFSIVIYDSFILFYKHQFINNTFLLGRGQVALYIFVLSLLSSICYYFIQSILKNRWESLNIDEESIGQE